MNVQFSLYINNYWQKMQVISCQLYDTQEIYHVKRKGELRPNMEIFPFSLQKNRKNMKRKCVYV